MRRKKKEIDNNIYSHRNTRQMIDNELEQVAPADKRLFACNK